MKASAIAHSNIALVKYWGKSTNYDSHLNIPLNDTLSMTKCGVSGGVELKTHTTIEFRDDLTTDTAYLGDDLITGRGFERVLNVVEPLRKIAGVDYRFKMVSKNDFPTQAGLASSASAFAALALSATFALDLKLSKSEISTYARLGSGSAARSIHGGFVYCHQGNSHETAYAERICNKDEFDMQVVVAIIDDTKKKVSSDEGHQLADSSPFNAIRISESQKHAKLIQEAILSNNFAKVGQYAELNCLMMHSVMMTSNPPLFYWNPTTFKIIRLIQQYRDKGLECYFTIDAGPNIHCLCQQKNVKEVQNVLKNIDGVKKTIIAQPADDSYITDKHLFRNS